MAIYRNRSDALIKDDADENYDDDLKQSLSTLS